MGPGDLVTHAEYWEIQLVFGLSDNLEKLAQMEMIHLGERREQEL